jgi:hypothetical protein
MAIQPKDIKLLWGRSGNLCAICKRELTQDKNAVSSAFTLGEQAHIVGEKTNAPRGISSLSLKERNNYHNLILLCPTHHREIDENIEDYPVEKLHILKSQHELFVTESLSANTNQVLISQQASLKTLIDNTVSLCVLNYWFEWTSYALAPTPSWDKNLISQISIFRQNIFSYIWNKESEKIKNAITIFSIKIHEAVLTFEKNSQPVGDRLQAYKFYQADGWNPNYHNDVKKYDAWVNQCYYAIIEATKALNWFADTVRDTIDPIFFIDKGKFLIQTAQYFDEKSGEIKQDTLLLEYTDKEKKHWCTEYGLST